jgi:hypothetical protein
MADDPFDSAEFTLRRALHHAENFDRLATEFMKSEPYASTVGFNAETGFREVRIKVVRNFPEDLRGAAADAVKNIRDALDQAMSAATFIVTGKRPRRTHFPFGESEDDLENSLSRRKAWHYSDIPEELFPAIRFIKPYPHEGDDFRLKLLQKVSGPHKHSVALSLGCSTSTGVGTIEMFNSFSATIYRIDFPEWDSSKGEVAIMSYPFELEDKLEFNISVHVAFDHPLMREIPAIIMIKKWGQRAEWITRGLKKTAERIVAERFS